jgi:hypothetical protein
MFCRDRQAHDRCLRVGAMGLFEMTISETCFAAYTSSKRTPLSAGWEAPALDHGYLVRHVGVRGIAKPIAEHGAPGAGVAECRK